MRGLRAQISTRRRPLDVFRSDHQHFLQICFEPIIKSKHFRITKPESLVCDVLVPYAKLARACLIARRISSLDASSS